MAESDIPAGLRLCRAAGWNQIQRDWELFLRTSPHGCFVAEAGDIVVGTVTTIRYGADLAWLSMVLVDPAYRGKGIGTALLERALEAVADVPCVKLDATPEGRRIYQHYGFVDELRLWRMEGRGGGQVSSQARPFTELSHPILVPDYSWQLPSGATISGRPGHLAAQLGPVTADSQEDAAELVNHVLALYPDQPFFVDAIEPVEWLIPLGFSRRRELIRMVLGRNTSSNPRGYAIIGPEYG